MKREKGAGYKMYGNQYAKTIINIMGEPVFIKDKKEDYMINSDAIWVSNLGKGYHHFTYRNEKMSFIGRENEKKELTNFLSGNEKFKCLLVTGRAGSGKSRLVYDTLYEDETIKKNWKVCGLQYKQLKEYSCDNICSSGIKKIVFVIDYVLLYAAKIGKWIESIYEGCKLNDLYIRIILIERSYKKNNEPYWYIKLKSRLGEILDEKYHIQLGNMSDEELKKIFIQYIEKNAERYEEIYGEKPDLLLCGESAELIIQRLDERCKIPLYMMYIADAWITDRNKYGRDWNETETLRYIVEKEEQRLTKAFNNNKKTVEALKTILVYAMAFNGLNLNKVDFLCDEFETVRGNLNDADVSLRNIFNEIGNISDRELVLYSTFPDIVCEYYCLQFLKRKIEDDFNKEFVLQFIEQCWKENPTAFSEFLCRLIADFHNNSMINFEYILKRPRTLTGEREELYADVLQEYTYWNNAVPKYYDEICGQYDLILEHKRDTKALKTIHKAYASTLFNMAYWYEKSAYKNEIPKEYIGRIYKRSRKINQGNDDFFIRTACTMIEKIKDKKIKES